MQLSVLLECLDYQVIKGNVDTEITNICYHTKEVREGAVFVCITGATLDGHNYIHESIELGAKVIVVERDSMDEDIIAEEGLILLKVENTRIALALMSCAYYGYPAEKVSVIGITGTKGKTTASYMIKEILEQAGIKTGLIGTIETVIGDKHIPNDNTTPESYVIQKYMSEMVTAGCECVVMEVSSQGLKHHRVEGIPFDYGIFTNLAPDHIGDKEHKDFEEYMNCKKMLFSMCKVGLYNMDDNHVENMMEGASCVPVTYGMKNPCNFKGEDGRLLKRDGFLGTSFHMAGSETVIELSAPGLFNIYNALAAITIGTLFGIPQDSIVETLKNIRIKGRVEVVPIQKDYTLMIDYAHNAMSLKSVLETLREYNPNHLICMFGCGGNRSKARRYEMGEVSSVYADITVVTSDNPRYEEPLAIIDDILIGVNRGNGACVVIPDRKEAIRYCILNGSRNDIIVLAGKGHETYQEIKGVKYPMDERVLVDEIVREEEIEH